MASRATPDTDARPPTYPYEQPQRGCTLTAKPIYKHCTYASQTNPSFPYNISAIPTRLHATMSYEPISTVLAGISALVGILALVVAVLQLCRYRRRRMQRQLYHHLDVSELEARATDVRDFFLPACCDKAEEPCTDTASTRSSFLRISGDV